MPDKAENIELTNNTDTPFDRALALTQLAQYHHELKEMIYRYTVEFSQLIQRMDQQNQELEEREEILIRDLLRVMREFPLQDQK